MRSSNTQSHRDPNKSLDLFKTKDLIARLKLHAGFRHAVETADVAAIGDADA